MYFDGNGNAYNYYNGFTTLKCHLHHIFVIDEVPEIHSPFIKSLEEDLYQHNVTSNYGNYL